MCNGIYEECLRLNFLNYWGVQWELSILFCYRCLTGNCSALVEISVSRPLPLELYKDNRELGKWTHSVRIKLG